MSLSVLAVIASLLYETQILSHVTRRLVDGIGARAQGADPFVVVIESVESGPRLQSGAGDPAELDRYFLAPPPRTFVALSSAYGPSGELFVGAILDGFGVSPRISWTPIEFARPVILAAPPNAAGALFACLPGPTLDQGPLRLLAIVDYGYVDGCQVLGLC